MLSRAFFLPSALACFELFINPFGGMDLLPMKAFTLGGKNPCERKIAYAI